MSDPSGVAAALISGEAVGLGAAVSVFCSQAASARPAKMQMYFFINILGLMFLVTRIGKRQFGYIIAGTSYHIRH